MLDYDLALCYGIIVSDDKISEISDVLTDEEHDEMIDNYAHCINNWTGGDYFIGVKKYLHSIETDLVYRISDLSAPTEDDEDLINFTRFFNEHGLWKFIDWKPELLMINFCY